MANIPPHHEQGKPTGGTVDGPECAFKCSHPQIGSVVSARARVSRELLAICNTVLHRRFLVQTEMQREMICLAQRPKHRIGSRCRLTHGAERSSVYTLSDHRCSLFSTRRQ